MTQTEGAAWRFRDAELWPAGESVAAMFEAQSRAFIAVGSALDGITAASEAAAERLRGDAGRLVYAGAGASARLAVQDGVELVPTFGWAPERLAYLIAGGPEALMRSVEGAEDDGAAARAATQALALGPEDVVVAVAASGTTPFTRTVQAVAADAGALTIAFANNPSAPLLTASAHPILLSTGPEFLPGSTRMVAGTAQKIALNLFSTRVMMALGRVFRGRMVGLRATNAKLRHRAELMVAELAPCDVADATAALQAADGDVRLALLVHRGLSVTRARTLLEAHQGDLHACFSALDADVR